MNQTKRYVTIGLMVSLIICLSLQIQAVSKIEAEWKQVMAESQSFLKEVPDDLHVRFKLAVAYANLGYLNETIQELELMKTAESGQKAQEIIAEYELMYSNEPENLQVMNYLAFAYYANDQFRESEEMFQKIIQIDPGNLWAHNYYALVQGNRGDYDAALETLKQARKIQDNKYTHFILSLVYYKKGQIFKSMYHLSKSGDVGLQLIN